jgi:serine/threonine protein kinase
MKEGTVLKQRYALRRMIGQGGTAVTWLADDRESGNAVVVKLLSLGLLDDWKAFELLEREASVLRSLHFDGIPAYVDYFRTGGGANTRFVLVQEYVAGQSLQQKVGSGWRGTEEEIRAIGVRLLRAVAYIHSLRPPIIHRDINPRNIIEREDGSIFLVDFGGVQDAARVSASSGSTVIGTPGYMPMEQFVGKATVRSDLYGCAATLLFLLTHRNPQDLPTKDMKIDASAVVELSPGLSRVLDSWLEPDEKKRTLPIATAIECLEGRFPANQPDGTDGAEGEDAVDLVPPRFSRIRVESEGDSVLLAIPERGALGTPAVFGGFSLFWLAFVAFWTVLTVRLGAWPMSLFSIPFWLAGFYMARRALNGFFGRTHLRFDPSGGFTYEHRLLLKKKVTAALGEVRGIGVANTGKAGSNLTTALRVEVGARSFSFGEHLSGEEKRWLQRNINGLVNRMRK